MKNKLICTVCKEEEAIKFPGYRNFNRHFCKGCLIKSCIKDGTSREQLKIVSWGVDTKQGPACNAAFHLLLTSEEQRKILATPLESKYEDLFKGNIKY